MYPFEMSRLLIYTNRALNNRRIHSNSAKSDDGGPTKS